MTRRAILHIGAEKTGTTALQLAFREDAERMALAGVRYPDLGGLSHAALVYAAADETEEVADLGPHIGLMPGETRTAFTARLHDRLAEEVRSYDGARFVLSTEHAQSRLVSAEAIARIRALLAQHFDEVEIAVYLRRWDRMATSFHSTRVRNGPTAPFSFARFAGSTLLDYRRLLDRWAEAFGEAHLHVGIFDRRELVNGSILDDFTTRFGLPTVAPVADQNVSLDAAGQALMRIIDHVLVDLAPEKRDVVRLAVTASLRPEPGSVLPVTKQQARDFVRRFARDDAAICKRWFPGRTSLFDDRFDEYAEMAEPIARTWRDASAALVDALVASMERESEFRAETRFYRSLHHRRQGRLDIAVAEAREAVSLQPGSPHYWYVLAETLLRAERIDEARAVIADALRIAPENPDMQALAQQTDRS